MKQTVFEAGLNLVLSLVLVPRYGIRGALTGTCVALLYRLVEITVYVNHQILHESILPAVKLYGCNFVVFAGAVFIGSRLQWNIKTYGQFAVSGLFVTVICGIIFAALNAGINFHLYKDIYRNFVKRAERA